MIRVSEIKKCLIDYHKSRGYEIFNSFPILSDDPTVLFINATITPFKESFANRDIKANNFAIVQRCFRAGGSQSLNKVGYDPSLSSFFEMFGTGTFGVDCLTATKHLFEVLELLDIKKSKLYFTVPLDDDFLDSLKFCGITKERIFSIENNEVFWCDWQFGKGGLTGKGLTVVYSKEDKKALSVNDLRKDSDNYIELLNLIHIYGQQSENGDILPVANPGFEIGVGIGRIASILQGCNCYQVDNVNSLVKLVSDFFELNNHRVDIGLCRACTDCLQSLCILMNEGISPSNKGASYVLRKMIRRLLEQVWTKIGNPVNIESLVQDFYVLFSHHHDIGGVSVSQIVNAVRDEYILLEKVLVKGAKIMRKNPGISGKILFNTYGLSAPLASLVQKMEIGERL